MEEDEAERECFFCRTIFESRDLRIAHEIATHRPWHCVVCEMNFPTAILHEEHQKAHQSFSCDKCTYVCKTKTMLRQHAAVHLTSKDFKCTICSKAFVSTEYLAKHKRRHERVRPYQFPCEKCVRAFRTRPSLLKHKETYHDEQHTYDCHFCGKKFGAAVYLQRHEKRHQKDKQIPCKSCNIICKNAWTLRKHRAAEHKKAPVPP